MKYLIRSIAILAVSFGLASAAEPAVGGQLPNLNSLLPAADLPNTSGKVVLVDFWASWCAPCKASFATLSRLHAKYASRGLVIIGIGVDDEEADFRKFAAKHNAAFSLAHDARHQAAERFNPTTMPTSYLVDRSGKIRHVHQGFKGARTEAEYIAEIEQLLGQ